MSEQKKKYVTFVFIGPMHSITRKNPHPTFPKILRIYIKHIFVVAVLYQISHNTAI